MNYLNKDVNQLIKDAKRAIYLLNTKQFDRVNWLAIGSIKGAYGIFSSIEWIHFNNIEKHLSDVLLPDTKIFETTSDIDKNQPISINLQNTIKQSVSFTLQGLLKAKSRMFLISQTAKDMDVHNKTFYNYDYSSHPFINEDTNKNYVQYSRTSALYPKVNSKIQKLISQNKNER